MLYDLSQINQYFTIKSVLKKINLKLMWKNLLSCKSTFKILPSAAHCIKFKIPEYIIPNFKIIRLKNQPYLHAATPTQIEQISPSVVKPPQLTVGARHLANVRPVTDANGACASLAIDSQRGGWVSVARHWSGRGLRILRVITLDQGHTIPLPT